MANLRDIRDRISSVKSTQQITKAMKMVAAARLRKAQDNMLKTRPYVTGMENVISKLSRSGEVSSPFLRESDNPQRILMIVIGSDRGLCGGFNTNLFRFVTDSIDELFYKKYENKTLHLVTVGRKATEFFSKRGYEIHSKYPGFFDRLSFESTMDIMNHVAADFKSDAYDEVYIAFNEFKSVIAQNRILKKVLPVTLDQKEEESKSEIDYIFEPSSEQILKDVIPLHLNMQLWRAMLESNASEQGARMAAMDNATENAKEIIRMLNLKYNQARQAAITTELSEIVSGAEALNG